MQRVAPYACGYFIISPVFTLLLMSFIQTKMCSTAASRQVNVADAGMAFSMSAETLEREHSC